MIAVDASGVQCAEIFWSLSSCMARGGAEVQSLSSQASAFTSYSLARWYAHEQLGRHVSSVGTDRRFCPLRG